MKSRIALSLTVGCLAVFSLPAPAQTNAPVVSAGQYHSPASREDGTVWAWGKGFYGQLGNGMWYDQPTAQWISALNNAVAALRAGRYHGLARLADGTLRGLGYNAFGQLGDGTTTQRMFPVPVTNLTSVAGFGAGEYHSVAVRTNGLVWVWGLNTSGQLGDGTLTNRLVPTQFGFSLLTSVPTAPTVWISSPPDNYPTNAASLPVTVAYSNTVGTVGTVLLKRDGTQVGSYENPGGIVSSQTTFNVQLSTLNEGTISFQALGYSGTNFTGLIATSTVVHVILDRTAPVVTCPDNIATNTASGQCSRAVTFTASATDARDGTTSVTCSPASGSTFNTGTTTVNCSSTDTVGNTGSCSFTVSVNDNQAPTISCPANITTNIASGATNAVVSFSASATDNCSPITDNCEPASDSAFSLGETTVTCTVTDAANNTANCSFTITVSVVPTEPVATPTFRPDGNVFTTARDVVIACATEGAVIHYTTNGNDPTGSDPVIASGGRVRVERNLTLKARAFKQGMSDSEVASAAYVITDTIVATPVIYPNGGSYTTAVPVTIECPTLGATIHYTTDGADPTEADPVIESGAILIVDASVTLKAKAWRTDWTPSEVRSAEFIMPATLAVEILVNEGRPFATNLTITIDPLGFSHAQVAVSSSPSMSSPTNLPNTGDPFSFALPDLGDVTHHLYLQYLDSNGVPQSAVFHKVVTVDTLPPVVQITGPTTNTVGVGDQAFITLQGIAYDPSPLSPTEPDDERRLKVWINDQPFYDLFGTEISVPRYRVQVGTNTVIVSAQDEAGNQTQAVLTWIVGPSTDTTAPVMSNFNILGDENTANTGVTTLPDVPVFWAQCDVDDSNAVITATVNGGDPIELNAMGSQFGYVIPVQPGTNLVEFIAQDAAGNATTNTCTVIRGTRYRTVLDLPETAGDFAMSGSLLAYFANGEPQVISGYVNAKEDEGLPTETNLVSVAVNGVAATIDWNSLDTNGNVRFTSSSIQAPDPGEYLPLILTVTYAGTNTTYNYPAGVLGPYFITRKETRYQIYPFPGWFSRNLAAVASSCTAHRAIRSCIPLSCR